MEALRSEQGTGPQVYGQGDLMDNEPEVSKNATREALYQQYVKEFSREDPNLVRDSIRKAIILGKTPTTDQMDSK